MAFEASIGNLYVELGLKDKLSGGLTSAEGHVDRAESKLGKLAGGATHVGASVLKMGAIVGGIGVASIGAFATSTAHALAEQQLAQKQTQTVIRSTGNAAHVTAGQIGGYAQKMQELTGIDDAQIQSGENLLLTFTNIQNKVGKGNDIFTQASTAMLNMSTALGQDTKSSAIQLGKALNDPIKGVTALRRVGVSFTQDQLKQIKALVASGKTVQAQKLILGELNKEFGHSAEAAGQTLPGAFNIMKAQIEDAGKEVLGTLTPALKEIVPIIGDTLSGLVKAVGPAVTVLVKALGPAIKALLPMLKPVADIFAKVLAKVLVAITPILARIGPYVGILAKMLGDVLIALLPLLDPIGAIITLLAPFITEVVSLGSGLIAQLVPALIQIVQALMPLLPPVIQLAEDLLPLLAQVLGFVAGIIAKVVAPTIRILVVPIKELIGWITSLVEWLFGAETDFRNILGRIAGVWKTIWGGISSFFGGIWSGIKSIAADAINWLISNIINPIIRGVNLVIQGINDINPFHDIPKLKAMAQVSFGGGGGAAGGGGKLEKLPGGKIMAFGMGGIVPGRVGAPMVAIVHGGEEVVPPGKRGSGVVININGDTRSPREIVRAVEWTRRAQGW